MFGWELLDILRCDPIIHRCHIDIVSLGEEWTSPTRLPACYVINTGNKNGNGEHWVSFYIDNDWSADYWDSYGTPPLQRIYSWLRRLGCNPIRYNKKMIQGFTSRTCGAYCVYFLHMRAMGIPLGMISDPFREYQFDFNDSLVRTLLKKLR